MREDVAFISATFHLSERKACKLLGVDRASYRYEPSPDRNAELREELLKLAWQSRGLATEDCTRFWSVVVRQ